MIGLRNRAPPPHPKEHALAAWIDRGDALADFLALAGTRIGLDTEFMRVDQ